jgi:hypothetical protein
MIAEIKSKTNPAPIDTINVKIIITIRIMNEIHIFFSPSVEFFEFQAHYAQIAVHYTVDGN